MFCKLSADPVTEIHCGSFQETSAGDISRDRPDREPEMGVGFVSFTCLDPLLLLCLERSEIHRKGTSLSFSLHYISQ